MCDGSDAALEQHARRHFDAGEPESCWLWRINSGGDGYGRLRCGGRTRLAHRMVYELLVGPIPHGMHIDHTCRVRACVNPAHLEPVTQAENNRRAWAVKFAANPHPCGHPRTAGGRCPTCFPPQPPRAPKPPKVVQPPAPTPRETGLHACGHEYDGLRNCAECARQRAARWREKARQGQVPLNMATCIECVETKHVIAKGLCRRCYTRLYKRKAARI